MSVPHFDLVDVVQTIRKKRTFIIAITILAALAGAAFFFTRKKKFVVKSEFIVSNPLYADRNNLFRNTEMRFVDYVGGDDDLDRVTVVAESDTVIDEVCRNQKLYDAYEIDMTKPDGWTRTRNIVKNALNLKRSEYKDIQLTYTDTDPNRAASVAWEIVYVTEKVYRGYYNFMRGNVYKAISAKIHEQDSSINTLTDSLATMRNKYGIYDIISPARPNILVGTVKASGGNSGMGIEQIQNVESIKDQLVSDRAKYVSLMNEFSTGTKLDQIPLLHYLTTPKAPMSPKGPGLLTTVLACTLIGLFFSSLYVLLTTYYRSIMAVKR